MKAPDPLLHPGRAALLAHLFQQSVPDLPFARFLDLDAGEGERLFALADFWPAARFLGVTSKAEALNARAAAYGLKRLRFVETLEQADQAIYDLLNPGEERAFDVIWAAGQMSELGVSLSGAELRAARQKLLAQVGLRLSGCGLALLSFDSEVGGALLGALPKMLRALDLPSAQAQAQALAFFARFMPKDDPLSELWGVEARSLLEGPAEDWFAHRGAPLSLVELCALLPKAGLCYVGHPDLSAMVGADDPETSAQLCTLALDQPRRESLLEWRYRRPFRQAILCRIDRPVDRNLSYDRFLGLYAEPVNLRPYRAQSGFGVLGGGRFWTDPAPDVCDALLFLAGCKQGVATDRLFSNLQSEALKARFCEILLQWTLRGLCRLSFQKPRPMPELSEGCRFFVSPVVRDAGELAVNHRYESYALDRFDRAMLPHLTGQTLEDLADALLPQVESGELRILGDGEVTTERGALIRLCQTRLERLVRANLCDIWPKRED